MPLDRNPGRLVIPTRTTIKRNYLRDYRVRNPAADVGPNTQPDLDASTFADQQVVVYHDARVIARSTLLRHNRGKRLDEVAKERGLVRNDATGASGYVSVTTSLGGGQIVKGDVAIDDLTNLRYQCLATALYKTGSQVPVVGVDTGPTTNQAAGIVLRWVSPRPGVSALCTVVQQADGSGLKGGAPPESDELLAARIIDLQSNPPASGNSAQYIKETRATPTLSVEAAWSIPAVLYPGTKGIIFTVVPETLGGSRIPNGAQISLVLGHLVSQFPADDGIFVHNLSAQNVVVVLSVSWQPGAATWANVSPWPAYVATSKVSVDGAVTPTATSFRATTSIATTTPQIGQSIAVYDAANRTFRPKRILTVSTVIADKSWDLTFDTSNNASDTTYTPAAGQPISPWSTALDDLVSPLLTYFESVGPGEVVSSFPDPGQRLRRFPFSPASWPSVLTSRMLVPILGTRSVIDASIVEPTLPLATTVGTPGALAYLLQLSDIAVFPQ